MVFDSIQNISKYGFKEIEEFLKDNDVFQLQPGKHEISENTFVFVNEYSTKEPDYKFEGHEKYIDVQYLVKGIEYIYVARKDKSQIVEKYDGEKDVLFATCNESDKFLLDQGEFAILYPNDLHMCIINVDEVVECRKLVFKVKI